MKHLEEVLEKAIEIYNSNITAYSELIYLCIKQRRFKKARVSGDNAA